jgi:hypothetical protein
MIISDEDENTIDYDWFAVDDEGHIGHFATGGCGIMPRSVAASAEDLETITNFFRKDATAGTTTRLSLCLSAHATFKAMLRRNDIWRVILIWQHGDCFHSMPCF